MNPFCLKSDFLRNRLHVAYFWFLRYASFFSYCHAFRYLYAYFFFVAKWFGFLERGSRKYYFPFCKIAIGRAQMCPKQGTFVP